MKSVTKKLYAVLIVSVLMLCFSVVALASGAAGTPPGVIAPPTSTSDTTTTSTDTVTSFDTTTSDETGSDLNGDSSGTDSSDLVSGESMPDTSGESSMLGTISMESDTNQIPSAIVSQKPTGSKVQYGGNTNANIDDGIDTSGWGDEDEVSEPVSVGKEAKKAGNKKMLDVAGLFWILIWIPVLLIIASIVALIYVNRKGFVGDAPASDTDVTSVTEGEEISSTSDNDKKQPKKKAKKAKENHSKRTNVYRPRD